MALTPRAGLFEAVDRVFDKFVKDKKWRLAFNDDPRLDHPEHRHAASFVRRRAEALLRANPTWQDEDTGKEPFTSVTGRLNTELAEIDRYLVAKLGDKTHRGPLSGGTDPVTPNHLDLADVAQRKTNEPSTTLAAALADGKSGTQHRVRAYLRLRRTRVTSIVWRAVALHPVLWSESADHKTGTLNRIAMDEVLDRRLRVLERMNLTISDLGPLGGVSKRTLQGPTGPWLDGFRIRMFEYPRVLDNTDYRQVLAGKIAPNNTLQFRFTSDFDWVPDHGKPAKLHYNRPPNPGIHFFNDNAHPPTGLRTSFVQDSDPDTTIPAGFRLRIVPAAGLTVANVIDQVFTPSTNVWERSWLFCDHVIAALHIEALLFAMRRRFPNAPNGTQRFNDIAAAHPAGFFSFDALFADDPDNPTGDPTEFGDDPSKNADHSLIENVFVDQDDLQPGDHIVFWNNQIYTVLSSGDWKLENSLVMNVDSDPATGGVTVTRLRLQGHGTAEKSYADFQKEISDHLTKPLADAIKAVKNRPRGATEVPFGKTRLVSWTPYDSFQAPGAWWIEVIVDKDHFHDNVALALASIPKSLAIDPNPLPGYTPPPTPPGKKAVYFPLFEPQVTFRKTTGWTAYFLRRGDADFRPIRQLKEVKPDRTLLPGLDPPSAKDIPGSPSKIIEVIRPAVIL